MNCTSCTKCVAGNSRQESHGSESFCQALQPIPRPSSKLSDRQHEDLLRVGHVGDSKREPGQEEAPDFEILGDSGPPRPGGRPLGYDLQGALEFLGEISAEAGALPVVPVAGGREVQLGAGMEADLHELPARPAASEARPHRGPVLRLHRAGKNLAGALLQLGNPCLCGIGIHPVVKAEDELVGDAGTLPNGERQGGGKDVRRLGRHRTKYSH